MFSRSAALFLAMLVLLLYAGKPAAAHEKEEGTVVKAGGGKLVLTSKGKESRIPER
jgi:hypothetical protein